MKFTWEAKDIVAGMTVRSTITNAVNALFMIGYMRIEDSQELVLISLADGHVFARQANDELMAAYLNGGYRPYRLVLTEQVHDKFEKVSKDG